MAVFAIGAMVAAPPASATVPNNGWGFAIADDSDPSVFTSTLSGPFVRLAPKAFRFMVDWDAGDRPDQIEQARQRIAWVRGLGVEQIVVSFRRHDGFGPPSVGDYATSVREIVDELSDGVDVWGPANEPNCSGGMPGPGPDSASIAAGYYLALVDIRDDEDSSAGLLSPDFCDYYNRSSVAGYVHAYKDAGGGFGGAAAWHPYWGAYWQDITSTEQFIGELPTGTPIWVTEVGGFIWNPGHEGVGQTEAEQWDDVNWIINTLAKHARVDRIHYYHMLAPGPGEWDSALLRDPDTQRDAYRSWCAAAHGGGLAAFNLGACQIPTRGPGVSSWGAGRLDVFVRGPGDQLWDRPFDNGQWYPWVPLGGVITSDPDAVSWGPGRIDVVARGADDALYHKAFANGAWQPWERLGGILTSSPTISSWGPGRLDVFARATDNSVAHIAFDNGQWYDWNSVGGNITSDPDAVSWGPGRIDVFARGVNNTLQHVAWANGQWYFPWDSLSGVLKSGPGVSSWGPGRLDVFARGLDDAVAHRAFDNGQWYPWDNLGGSIAYDPDAVSWGFQRIDLFVRGPTPALFQRKWFEPVGGWSGFYPDG